MSPIAAFLDAIREDPDDDTPRLAFADWLQESGESDRAELIRTQIQQTRLPVDDDRHSDLHARELRILLAHTAAWTTNPPLMQSGRFRRGFVEYVSGTATDLIAQLPEIASLTPVREIRITNLGAADGLGAALAAVSALQHVDSIYVDDMRGDGAPAEQLIELFSSPHLRRVRKLTLFCGECNGELFTRLLALPALQHVEALRVNGGMDADEVIGVVCQFRGLPLRSLRIHKGPYGSWAMSLPSLQKLADSGHWHRLEKLDVGIRPAPALLADIVLGLPHSKIHTLCLHQGAAEGQDGSWMWEVGNQDYGIEGFAAADSWGSLRDLRFEYVEMNHGHLSALLAAKPLANLTRLSIFGGMLGPEEAAQLFRCKSLGGLRTLELSANFAMGPGLAGPLAEATHLTNLTDLRLIWTHAADAGAVAIAASPHFAKLRNLELANNFITAKGMTALAESPHLARVNRLRLFDHPVGPWQRLLGGPSRDTYRMTPEATAALAAGLPNLGCLELHGYNFPGETAAPLLSDGGKAWVTIEPRQIESVPLRSTCLERANQRGWFPPLDAYLEEEEPQP